MRRQYFANFTSGKDNQDRNFVRRSHQPGRNDFLLSAKYCILKFLEQLAGTGCCADLAFAQSGGNKEKEEKQCQTLPPSISEQEMV